MKKNIISFLLLFCYSVVFSQTREIVGIVSKVTDGDSFEILTQNYSKYSVRLARIDCPEFTQEFGLETRSYVTKLISKQVVKVIYTDIDKFGRLIAEVFLPNGVNLNTYLVKNGMAWHFKRFSDNAILDSLQVVAMRNKLGLWALSDPVAPWEFRSLKKP